MKNNNNIIIFLIKVLIVMSDTKEKLTNWEI